ncbi:hypothetical protein C8R46DRAFT_1276058 [Mycena filopes]|nr:hypothetical protein C8R46DRAFT_1276058 [Mycena filopes]
MTMTITTSSASAMVSALPPTAGNNNHFQLVSASGLGALELGIVCGVFLFGMLVVQVYVYYICNSDRPLVRLLVAAVFILEAAHTIATAQAIYYWTITLGDVPNKPGTVPGLGLGMIFEMLLTFLVQTYYIRRVHLFSTNTPLAAVLFTLSLLRLGGGITLAVGSFLNLSHEPDYFALQDRLAWLVTTTFSVGAGVDVCVAASLCVYVWRWKREPVMKTTSQLVNRIVFCSIQTGLITSVVSVTVVVCFQLMKDNYIWMGVFAILGKLYSNSLLASLNIRSLRRKMDPRTFALFSDDSQIDGLVPDDVEFARGSSVETDATLSTSVGPEPQTTPADSSLDVPLKPIAGV